VVRLKLGYYWNSNSRRLHCSVRRVLAVFTLSAITPLKVNRFGLNLENSEYIVWGWPWQILESWTARRNFCQVINVRFHRFPVCQILRNLNTTRRSVSRWKLSEQNVENLP